MIQMKWKRVINVWRLLTTPASWCCCCCCCQMTTTMTHTDKQMTVNTAHWLQCHYGTAAAADAADAVVSVMRQASSWSCRSVQYVLRSHRSDSSSSSSSSNGSSVALASVVVVPHCVVISISVLRQTDRQTDWQTPTSFTLFMLVTRGILLHWLSLEFYVSVHISTDISFLQRLVSQKWIHLFNTHVSCMWRFARHCRRPSCTLHHITCIVVPILIIYSSPVALLLHFFFPNPHQFSLFFLISIKISSRSKKINKGSLAGWLTQCCECFTIWRPWCTSATDCTLLYYFTWPVTVFRSLHWPGYGMCDSVSDNVDMLAHKNSSWPRCQGRI